MQLPAWRELRAHFEHLQNAHLRTLFAEDPRRAETMTVDAEGMRLDYSKNRMTAETMTLLLRLAEEAGLEERIKAMFAGDRINVTEDRPVLHVALRAPRDAPTLQRRHAASTPPRRCSSCRRSRSRHSRR
jgi:glucose-6-phosphate isomerase